MMSKYLTIIVFVTMFALLMSNYAHSAGDRNNPASQNKTPFLNKNSNSPTKTAPHKQSIADKYFDPTVGIPKQPMLSNDPSGSFCESDNTGTITVYSTNGKAQNEIDVKIDGRSIGSLKTYYPNGEPSCKTPSASGIITISVPAGKHILNANSLNLKWPNHAFSVDKCGCMVLPLS